MRLVKPQHFLPVHGEYSFLCAHAQLARSAPPSMSLCVTRAALHTLSCSPADPVSADCRRLQLPWAATLEASVRPRHAALQTHNSADCRRLKLPLAAVLDVEHVHAAREDCCNDHAKQPQHAASRLFQQGWKMDEEGVVGRAHTERRACSTRA
jgi:hypothetical protein